MYAPTDAAFATLAAQIAEAGINLDLTKPGDLEQLLKWVEGASD